MDIAARIKQFVKREIVLCISGVLALLSMLIVEPDASYISYIDFRTLSVLFCLMTIIESFRQIGVFDWMADKLLQQVHSIYGAVAVLVLLCFFLSMFITNDVALITFVPLALILMKRLNADSDSAFRSRCLITCIVMLTIAANLGSMLTPIGNPQNLFLYEKFISMDASAGIAGFIMLMLPYSVISLILLGGWLFIMKPGWDARTIQSTALIQKNTIHQCSSEGLVSYIVLFAISLLTVAHKIPYALLLVLVFLYSFFRNRRVLAKVDYSLLATFASLFIFIGNLGRIPVIADILQSVMMNHEMVTAVLASQVMSNVPAAVLLGGFTGSISDLIIGTNLGGLGTLIASMASLISFKYISQEDHSLCGRYMAVFTASNLLFLLILAAAYAVLH